MANKLYAVNCIDVHPQNESLIASGGSDCNLIIYNKSRRIKIFTKKFDSPVTSGKFTKNGLFYVYATGED